MPFENNILEKYKWLSSGLWMDHDNSKAQVYGYTAEGFYVFNETASDQGSMCKFKPFDFDNRIETDKLMETKLRNLDASIDALRNSDSWNQMVSDMQRAFPDAQTYTFPIIEENELPTIKYNYDMLQQFQNVHTTPHVQLEGSKLDITQDVSLNTVISKPNLNLSGTQTEYAAYFKQLSQHRKTVGELYNFDAITPTVDQVIENTAATSLWDVDSVSVLCHDNYFTHAIYTEIRYAVPGSVFGAESADDGCTVYQTASVCGATLSDIFEAQLSYTKMDYAPMITYIVKEGAEYTTTVYPFGETDNLVIVPRDTLKKLFLAETYALWNVPNNVIVGRIN